MPTLLIRVGAAILLAATAVVASAVPGVDPAAAPHPPAVAAASDDPVHAAAGFGLPEGFLVELFAAEPDVANPVAFSVDARGTAYVCETFRQNRGVTDNRGHDRRWVEADLASRTVEDRIAYHNRLLGAEAVEYEHYDDRVRRLSDTDGDGRADRVEVFADGFNRLQDGTAAGVLARRDDVWLTCIPSLYRLRDLDGDGLIDRSPAERQVLSTGYGVRVAFRGHDLHGLTLGPDGRIYYTVGDRGFHVEHEGRVTEDPGRGAVFRCDPDGRNLEVVAIGLRNPQELAFDDLGELFTVDNNSDAGDKARLVHLPYGSDSGWRMEYQYLDDRGPWHREKIWHTECHGQPAFCLPPVAHVGSGPSGFAACPGTGLTPHFAGRFLLADFRGNAATSSVRSFRVQPRGGSFVVADEEETFRNLLATDVEVGPDGAIWVSDWVQSWDGEGRGRLWRFLPRDRTPEESRLVAEVRSLLAADWPSLADGRLTELLAHADRRIRLESQWELARRGATSRLADLLAADSAAPLARIHAAQGLAQLLREGDAGAASALVADATDPSPGLRMVVARGLGDCPPTAGFRHAVRSALGARLGDDDLQVVVTAATSLGRLGRQDGDDPAVADAVVTLAGSSPASDRTVRHATAVAIAGTAAPSRLDALLEDSSPQVRLITCVALRRLRDDRLARMLDDESEDVVLEAARAIHDLPLDHLLVALAARGAAGPADDAFIRRAVSAAEQVGTAEAAQTLLAVVARRAASEEARGEAIDALRSWADPPTVNRVTGAWLPRAARREATVARDVLAASLDDLMRPDAALDEAERSSLLAAASRLGVANVTPLLRQWCTDGSRTPASRTSALDALLEAGDPEAAAVADQLVSDGAPLVRMAARRARAGRTPTTAIVADLVSACDSPDLAERQQAVGLIAAISTPAATEAVATLASRLRDGTLDPGIALEVNEAARLRLNAAPDARAAADPLSAWDDVLVGGDASRGRHVFFAKEEVSCVRCHHAEGRGGDVGPRLDGIATTRDPRHLLESIVNPNARVTDGFATVVIVTDEGTAYSGVVAEETPTVLTLKLADGRVQRIPVASIDERASGPSAMPADLAAKLSRRELRDLLAWLQSLR
ncbi:MAG: PQQ-dependent sugar dehydrogenase [Planctomycetes bacterium]|nr:PQQ-dependent sugar dehydrogenase [Planctomycetota bacterium]